MCEVGKPHWIRMRTTAFSIKLCPVGYAGMKIIMMMMMITIHCRKQGRKIEIIRFIIFILTSISSHQTLFRMNINKHVPTDYYVFGIMNRIWHRYVSQMESKRIRKLEIT